MYEALRIPDPQVSKVRSVAMTVVGDEDHGLACWSGVPDVMPRAHRHDGIEINYSDAGPMTYLFGGAPVRVPAAFTAVFWSSVPHQLIEVTAGEMVWWLTVPLASFLRFGLAPAAVAGLLRGSPLLVPTQAGDDHNSRYARWSGDLALEDAEMRAITLLEVEAHIRRLARSPKSLAEVAVPVENTRLRHATAMARHMALWFSQPITVADLAAVVHLHPTYAAEVFREVLGTTPAAYLTQRRIAEAQRLLLTTDATVTEIAHTAGFGSTSRFYACFASSCGRSPAAYRRYYLRLRQEA